MDTRFIWILPEEAQALEINKECRVEQTVIDGLQVGQVIGAYCNDFVHSYKARVRIRLVTPLAGTPYGYLVIVGE
jgi:hypothetical protein